LYTNGYVQNQTSDQSGESTCLNSFTIKSAQNAPYSQSGPDPDRIDFYKPHIMGLTKKSRDAGTTPGQYSTPARRRTKWTLSTDYE